MGTYTEIFFKGEIPDEQVNIITSLYLGQEFSRPDHPFFLTARASLLFSGGSAYFPGTNPLHVEPIYVDSFTQAKHVSFRANLKNYNNEIEKFFDWIEPHLREPGFYGYLQHEEALTPKLYIKEGSN